MAIVLITSIAIRLLAMVWTVVLLRRLRDWRMALLTGMLALMALRQMLTLRYHLLRTPDPAPNLATEMPGFVVSILALAFVLLLDRLLLEARRHRNLIESSPDVVFRLSATGKISYLNPAFESVVGWPASEWIGRSFDELVAPVDLGQAASLFQRVMGGETLTLEEIRLVSSSGDTLVGEFAVTPELVDGEVGGVLGIGRDITKPKQAEQELRSLERRYRDLFQEAPVMYLTTSIGSSEPVIEACNQKFLEFLGYESEEVIGRPLSNVYSEKASKDLLAGGGYQRALEGRFQDEERELVAKSGEVVTALLRAVPERDPQGKVVGTRAMYVDITELKKTQNELSRSRELLRALAARLHAVREDERTEISREIHDAFGQALTSLKIDSAWLLQRFPAQGSGVSDRLRSMISLLDSTLEGVRRLAARLRPPALDELGLEAAIEWQVKDFESRTSITCDIEAQVDADKLGTERVRDTAIFRILQEALTNVARHSAAEHAIVRFRTTSSSVILEVQDDGRGITDQQLISKRSLGVLGMRERAWALGGQIEVRRSQEKGTLVTLSMPLMTQSRVDPAR
jgi:PAS domain S-box-containing protein